MTKIAPAAAHKIATRLTTLEQEIDLAARSSARLPADLLEELARSGASPIEAQRVLGAVAETFTALVEARGRVARAHGLLLAYAKEQGLTTAFGDQFPCEDFVRSLADAADREASIVRIAA
ncbi:hypothetical protein GCM10011380_25920 [Sphingomonas metalli]|jgi:hypothetical protein|uniref:Uncharacterized protein n=1 Tax=Sphingomonas metalli TaxID=1779358 RepID=A0A916T936_9SPHN|nr:hypothetical protein [Sphingomonas metalli]GGB35337.1 hypothetical protein GCM10011380_25920 [Sphingomonas metalli]